MVKQWIIHEFIKKNIRHYLIGILALIAASWVSMAMPKLLGYITDCLSSGDIPLSEIYMLALYMFLLAVLLFGLKFVFRYFIMGKARDLECFLRGKLFTKLQLLSPSFYNQRKTGDLMSYAINDLSSIRMGFSFGIVFLVEGILINSIALILMVQTISPVLTLLASAPIIVAMVVILFMKSKIRRRFTKVQETFADLSDRIQENISGIRVVKAYVQEKPEIEKLYKSSSRRIQAQMDYVKVSGALSPSTQICFGISYTLVLTVGSTYVRSGAISLGDFIAFNTYLGLLMGPVNHLGRIVEVWQRAIASMKRLDSIFTVPLEIEDKENAMESQRIVGKIEIKDLNYTYPGTNKQVLTDINITVPKGKTLAIIGRTGSGKTTLINLITRLYKIDRGHIFIDGMDINDYSLETLRENIGYVPQDNFLFSTTIKTNIKFFKEAFSDQAAIDAAKAVSVYETINSFPDKFETITGERGVTLSGGQKQRVSMARAIIKTPGILILDDSLSAVDTKTEKEILGSIKEILSDRTGIIISHRISSIKHADEIIMMDGGRIIERGSHDCLMREHGEYYKLYQAQNMEQVDMDQVITGEELVAI